MSNKANKSAAARAAEIKTNSVNDADEIGEEDGYEIEETDPVFIKYGPPFIGKGKKVVMNDRAIAVKCATESVFKYIEKLKVFEQFDEKKGLWTRMSETKVARRIDDLVGRLAKEYKQDKVVYEIRRSNLDSVGKMMQPYGLEFVDEGLDGLYHVVNGIIDLRGRQPKLLEHAPKYAFHVSAGVKYESKAKCPRFMKELLGAALEQDDIRLLQKYLGSILIGPNVCNGILVIRGTPGGGKSTLVNIIERIIGEQNAADLRPKHLSGRFETSAFIGKRVLFGKDIPGDALAEKGARMLKSLTGDDLMQAEIKYNPDKQSIRGSYQVVIVSNNRLRIALDGDEEAWRRRLLVVDYEKAKPKRPIPHFAKKLVEEEGSGILNWLIEGAMAYRKELESAGVLELTDRQKERVSSLLEDSDSVQTFVKDNVVTDKDADLTSEELLVKYTQVCKDRQWKPVGVRAFQKSVPDPILIKFEKALRHDIMRDGKALRGYKGIALR